MRKKTASGITLTLLLTSMLTFALSIQPVEAEPLTIVVPDDYETIQWAVGNASDGDTIFIKAGTYYENVVVNKTVSLVGEEKSTTIIDGSKFGTVLNLTANHVNVSRFTIQNSGEYPHGGIRVYSFGNNISYNIIRNNRDGIFDKSSSLNIISENSITNNRFGIWLWGSSNNLVSGNSITNNNWYGIALSHSSNNTISGNSITNNNDYGIGLWESSNNLVSGNSITNNNDYGIGLSDSSNNLVSGNSITNNNGHGVRLRHSSNNLVSGNSITNNNDYGIGFWESSNNLVSGNSITNNWYGIRLYYSSNNSICHNNFIDNTIQAYLHESFGNSWDDGYPSGGNYWSDYTTRYPDAQELDDSGIWDTTYVIDEDNQDNYPLMEIWTPFPPIPRTIDELKTEIEKCWSEGEIDNQGIATSLIVKLNVAQKLVDKGKIDEAKSILEEDFIPQVQNVSGIHITVETADILIQSAEYAISHL